MPATPPTPTARQIPTGFKMPDGYQALVTFGKQPAVSFWEKTVKPPGRDGGNKIDTTTMLNQKYMTASHQHLLEVMDSSVVCAYDPDVKQLIETQMLNEDDTITYKYPDGTSECYYGFLQKTEYGELKKGEFPEVTLTIVATNTDPSGNEAGPVITPASGT